MTSSKAIKPSALGLLAAAAILSMPVLAGVQPAAAQTANAESAMRGTISVTGFGEASAKPDEARLSFTVLRQGENAKAAVDATSAAMREVIAGMRDLGAEDRDLQTATLQIYPQYGSSDQTQPGGRQQNEIVGYEARNTLSVTVRDIAKVGDYLDRAIELGVNQGGDVSFAISDDEALLNEARRGAIEDGRAKAELYAKTAGVSIDRIVSISEPSADRGPQPPMIRMRMAAESDVGGVPIEAGEISRSTSIDMTFSIRASN
ncbi:SIMPL domain-containing protein [Fulvimarina sp. MAC3]|uniref:SIMPL domain-containing protein n=1 Tax=Fulvimarina sp. MAC3 TaxID=3148887 RepID=UPI0031FBD6FD